MLGCISIKNNAQFIRESSVRSVRLNMLQISTFKADAGKKITKKVCFLKTESSMHIEASYERFEDYER